MYVKEPTPEAPTTAKTFVIIDPCETRTPSGEPLLPETEPENVAETKPEVAPPEPIEVNVAEPIEVEPKAETARDRFLEQIRHFQGNFRDREWRGRRSFFFWRDYMGAGAKYTEDAEERQREYHRRYDGWSSEKVNEVHSKLRGELGDGALDELEDRYRALYWPGDEYVETAVVDKYRKLHENFPDTSVELLKKRAMGM